MVRIRPQYRDEGAQVVVMRKRRMAMRPGRLASR
jgi:hypothetical protein